MIQAHKLITIEFLFLLYDTHGTDGGYRRILDHTQESEHRKKSATNRSLHRPLIRILSAFIS